MRKAFLFTALLSLLSTLLYGQLLTFSPPTLPDGEYGNVYSQQLTVTGGTAPYTFTLSLGSSLPPGMSLSSAGIISGKPTAIGSYTFTVTATDNSPLIPLIGLQLYTLVVDPAPLTIAANNVTMTYGGTLPPLTVSYTGFVNNDNATSLTTQPTIGTAAGSSSGVGTYPISVSSAADPNYTITYVPGTVTVGAAALTITANPAGSVYGAPLVASSALTVSYSGFVNSDGPGNLTQLPTVANAANAGSPAGGYPLTPSGAQSPNYSFTYVNGLYTISAAPLTITAVNQTMTYGGTVPTLTAAYTGFVNNDDPASLTKPPNLSTAANATSPAGPYPITVSGAVDPNYTISYVAGTITVGKATLTVTADDKTMPLGGPLPAFTVSYSGFLNGDGPASLTTPSTATTAATATSGAGAYPITPAGGVASNYTFSYVNGILTVGKAVLTITANPAGSVYGAPLVTGSSLTVSYSGFVNGDGPGNLTQLPTVGNSANAGSAAGTYTLTPSGALSPNYTVNYVTGAYTISPAPLTINAVNQTMTYGGPVPTLTASYSGFVNGDGPGSLSTPPTITTTATTSSPIGTYPITMSGAVDPNYTITYNSGTMTVGKAILTITADSKAMPLGGPLPTLTVSYSGFVNGDNISSLTTQPSITVLATSASPAGSYTITAFGAVDANYTITYVPGILAVGKALLTITVNPASSIYGAPLVSNSALTFTYAGFVNGDGPGNLTQLPVATNTAVAGSPVGSYALIPSGAQDPNYVINYINGAYTISPAALTITAANATMTYGGTVPALTATYSGFVNGDGPGSLSTLPALTTGATSSTPAGTYPITASGAVDANYAITYVPGTMTIQRGVLTITPNPASMTYGGTVPRFTVAYSGFVNGDTPGNLTTSPTISTRATSSSPAGAYPITASGAVSPNYSFVYDPGTLTIDPAMLHVTANAASKKYGAQDPTFSYAVSGLLNGDNSSIFSGSLSRMPGEDVGIYPITIGTLSAGGNYTIDFTGNTLTITIGSQQITWTQSLIVGCNATTQISLTATTSSGLPVTYSVSDPAVATVSGNILTLLTPGTAVVTATQAGDGNYSAAPAVVDTVDYQSASLIRQRWNDAIFFDNSSGDYVQWQWYKNGDPIPGATDPYYSETPYLDGQYFVIATNKDSQLVQSCILNITPGAAIPGGIKAYPNPTTPGGMVTINCNYTSSALQGAVLQIIDLNGRVRQQLTTVQPSMQVTMPAETGTYIVDLLLAGGQKASINVLVLPQ
ncbi:MAG TPA: MBG domain-containing protein [Puia sp.]|nr:MBG domain-containing protein [Puia sp.]